MKIACVGGGPAGLYFSILMKLADPANEVLILTGSGAEFMMSSDPQGFALEEEDMEHWAYEYAYKDGRTAPDTINVLLEYPAEWTATFEVTLVPGIGDTPPTGEIP